MNPLRAPAVPWAAYACLAGSMTLVGSYVGLSKLLVAAFPVFLLAWLRFGIAAVVMIPWVIGPSNAPALSTSQRRLLFLESFLGNFLFSICMLAGVGATSALAAGVVMAMLPATVAWMSWLFLREPLERRQAVAIALAVMGVVLLVWARTPSSGQAADPGGAPWWGYALLVAAVFCEASYVVIGKRLSADISAKRISAWINLWGLALVTPWGLWQALDFDFPKVVWSEWLLLLFYALAASVATVWLWMRGLQSVPAARAGVFTIFLPMSSALVGVWGLGEPFGALHAGAFATALAGLLVATWPASAPSPAKRP
ncbi:MAG: hypothetical protein RI949_1341 [Pseudomonadota bacterium]